MKIALIAPQPFVDIRATPLENLRLSRVLVDAGHTVEVITFPFGKAPECPGATVHRCRPVPFVRRVGIGLSPAKLLMDASLMLHARRLVCKGGFDCIHGVEEGALIGVWLGRMAGIPVVYDMDSILSCEVARSRVGRIPPAAWLARIFERWGIRNSDVVMTISPQMADYVRRIDPAKEVVIVPDVPLPLPPGGPDPDRARAQMPPRFVEGRKIVMYAGSLAGYQGIDTLVDAMARVVAKAPDTSLVIVGGDEGEIGRIAKQAKVIGVIDNLLFLGKRPPEEVPHFLSTADVLVSPRRSGINPPAKIYTYMQSSRPLVVTDIPAHTSVLRSDAAVLVEPTPDGIAQGILWALVYPEESARRGARAREMVKGLTPEYQRRKTLEVYERVAEKVGALRRAA